MLFTITNVTIISSSHLIEVAQMNNSFNLKEGEPLKGFDHKGLFYEHLTSMRYKNIFTRVAKGIDDIDPDTHKKKENKIFNDDLVTEIK
jgi:hypothetical protein